MIQDGIQINDSERQPCEIWTRVMGYFRPYGQYNIGKKSEYNERKWFTEEKATESIAQKCA